MGVAHVGLVHRDPCECKVKGFRAVFSIERNVPKRRHLQGVRQRGPRGSLSRHLTLSLCCQVENVRPIPASYVGHTHGDKKRPVRYWNDTLGAGSDAMPILGLDPCGF